MQRIGDDMELLSEMADYFQKDSTAHLKRIRIALQGRDTEELETVAHSLKGSAGNLGGLRAVQAARAVESLAKSGRSDIDESVGKMEAEIEQLMLELDRLTSD